ncbi:MAG: DUF1624 domain-containing protein [Bryobacteraceae bacterium]
MRGSACSTGTAAFAPRATRTRVTTIDTLRGFVMVLMALDHTREFFTGFAGNPLDPQQTTFMLFVTRWVTHLCAPVFVLLAGTSIFLQQQRKTRSQLTRLLLTRGLWLIIVELTLVHLVFNFHWQWNIQLLEVIWVIGASMMIMALLVWLPVFWNLTIGTLLILGHNAFDALIPEKFGALGWFWRLLHVPGPITGPPMNPPILIVAYPLLPWTGVMALGYAFGCMVLKDKHQRIRFESRAGALMLGAFLLLRWSNLYGDSTGWTTEANWPRTLLSFLNVQKYPPSLLFLLATLGIAALIMAAIEYTERRASFERAQSVLKVYGQVPFFYFLLHIALIHLLAIVISAASGGNWRWWLTEIPNGGVLTGHPSGYGYGLGVIWCIWIFVVALCYPACKWYRRLKMHSGSPLFSYL